MSRNRILFQFLPKMPLTYLTGQYICKSLKKINCFSFVQFRRPVWKIKCDRVHKFPGGRTPYSGIHCLFIPENHFPKQIMSFPYIDEMTGNPIVRSTDQRSFSTYSQWKNCSAATLLNPTPNCNACDGGRSMLGSRTAIAGPFQCGTSLVGGADLQPPYTQNFASRSKFAY